MQFKATAQVLVLYGTFFYISMTSNLGILSGIAESTVSLPIRN